MAVIIELHNTGDTESQRDVRAMIEHVLSDRRGDWRVSIIGSQAKDRWGDDDSRSTRFRALLHA